jgi:flagella basal body P-ring formation protein FlgA
MIRVLFIAFSILFNPARTTGEQANSLKNEVYAYLKNNLKDYKEFEYEILQMPDKYKKALIEKSNGLNISGNLAYIPVRIVTANNREAKTIITVRLKLFQDVLVAAKAIKQKENLTQGDFEFKKVDVTQVRGTPAVTFKGIDSFRSKMNIKAGDVLTMEEVEEKPVIVPGDLVTASYAKGSVIVSTDAISKQEGTPGEVITIITKDKRQFKARVIDSQHVNIIE